MAAVRDPRASARGLLARGPTLLPAAAATGVLVYLATRDAGYEALPDTWQLCTLFILALLVLALVTAPAAGGPPRLVLAAASLLGGYAAWSYLSIAWADQRADAWDGANRTALYAIVFALFGLWPLGRRGATLVVGTVAAAIGLVAVAALLKADLAGNPETIFVNGRLGWPVNYPNGTVALWFIGFWPCVALASRREVHPLLRGVFLALAVVLSATALLGQSRGWLFAVPIVTAIFLVVSPGRLRLAWTLIAVALATLVVGPTTVDVHERVVAGEAASAEIDSAVLAILLAALALGALGVAAGYLDRRLSFGPAVARRAGIALAATAAAAILVGAVTFVAREGNPVTWADARWEEFKGGPQPTAAGARFTQTLGSNRYDFWRVAWDGFRASPLVGIGADNFRHEYLRERGNADEEPYYPHSLVMRTLGQTGLIGGLLLGAALGCAVGAALRAVRGSPGLPGAAAAAALTSFAYFAVHGAVDWFWELPALGGIAFALLGVAAGLHPRPAVHPRARRAREPLANATRDLAVTVVVAGLLLAAIGMPYLAMRANQRAVDMFRDDRASAGKALDLLDRAAGLNPYSTVPRLLQGQILVALGQPEHAAGYYRDAIERDPQDEYSHLALGALESMAGRRAQAERLLARALELSPRDPLARELLERVRAGRPVDVRDVNKDFDERRANRAR